MVYIKFHRATVVFIRIPQM